MIGNVREAGIDHFVLDVLHHGYDSLGYGAEQLESWATDVVPLLG